MFPYTLTRNNRSRSIRIRISSKGEVLVSAPTFVNTKDIEAFIEKSTDWIQKAVAKTTSRIQVATDTELAIFGKKYTKVRVFSKTLPTGITIQGNNVVCNTLSQFEEGTPWRPVEESKLERFLRYTAENYITPRTFTLATAMSTKFNRISYKEQRTRWGSCSSQGNLNFNWRLVHFEPKVIDYVIIHELAHRTHMDHSTRFWHLVAQYDPEYVKHRNTLKKFSVGLD